MNRVIALCKSAPCRLRTMRFSTSIPLFSNLDAAKSRRIKRKQMRLRSMLERSYRAQQEDRVNALGAEGVARRVPTRYRARVSGNLPSLYAYAARRCCRAARNETNRGALIYVPCDPRVFVITIEHDHSACERDARRPLHRNIVIDVGQPERRADGGAACRLPRRRPRADRQSPCGFKWRRGWDSNHRPMLKTKNFTDSYSHDPLNTLKSPSRDTY
jgi:hypothetical protein